MKKPLLFIGALALVVGLAAFFYTGSAGRLPPTAIPTPTPYSLPTVNTWNGIEPGVSSLQSLVSAMGAPVSSTQNRTTTTYSYPSDNQYWKNEVDVENNSVAFIRARIFPPSDTSLKSLTSKLKEKPTQLYGPDHQSGTLLYLYPSSGVAYVANSFRDTVYQVWYFTPTTVNGFLSLHQSAGYGTSPTARPEGI